MIVTDAVYASATATTPLTTRSYTYYPTSALKSVTENGVTLTYTYDERGNVLTESDGTSTKNYTYNLINQRGSYVLTVGGTVVASEAYTYDAMYRLSSVTTNYSTTTYTYDTWGNRTGEATNANSGYNGFTQYAYDAANRLTAIGNVVNEVPVTGESYSYNLDGSMREKSGEVTTTYLYDGAGRLRVELVDLVAKSYTYDTANNRVSMNDNGTTTTYTYDANNRMLTETVGGSTKTYTYDANGNMLTGDGATYTYNARGQQASYSKNGTTAAYTYLPTGLRKAKTVGLTMTNYVWDGQNLAYEYTGSNTASGKAYFYGMTLISQGNAAYYLYNGHGDVVQLCNGSGTLTREYDYDAFGNEVSPNTSDTNPFRYAGQYYDVETGTYYLRARYYDPGVGRFTQRDTHWNIENMLYGDDLQTTIPQILAISQSSNRYVYALNSPILYQDHTGNSVILTCVIVGATIGAVAGGGIGAYASHQKYGYVDGWWVAGGVVGGATVGGVIGGGAGSFIVHTSWGTAATAITSSASTMIGRAFEQWFYDINKISRDLQQIYIKGIGRIDAFFNGRIIELKNYSWNKYTQSQLNSIGEKFVTQAQKYMQITDIQGKQIKGITFYFSQKPPTIITNMLKEIGVQVKWVPWN